MNALASESLIKLTLENFIDGMDNEIHHLDGRYRRCQPLGQFGEGVAEKFVVKLNNDLLLRQRIVDTGSAALHTVIEFLKAFGLFREVVLMQGFQNTLHRP